MSKIMKKLAYSIFSFIIAVSVSTQIQQLNAALLDKEISGSLEFAISQFSKENLSIDEIDLKELSGGMSSNKLYSLKIAEEKYVLRILSTKHTLAARQNEIDAHEIGAALGIAPEIVYKDKDFKFIVMRFINGHILTRNDLQNPTVIAYLGNMIGKLHSYQGQFQNIRTQNDRVRKHCERAISKDNAFPSIYKNLYEDFILSGSIINKNDLVFSHADLNAANILFDENGRIYFIDWTSATWDHRYTDLGYFSLLNGMTDEQAHIFLEAYLKHSPTVDEWYKFKLAQKRTCFVTATVWLDFAESPEDKLLPKIERIAKLDSLLNSKDLKTGTDYIADGKIISPTSGDTEAIKLFALGFLKNYIEFQLPKPIQG